MNSKLLVKNPRLPNLRVDTVGEVEGLWTVDGLTDPGAGRSSNGYGHLQQGLQVKSADGYGFTEEEPNGPRCPP